MVKAVVAVLFLLPLLSGVARAGALADQNEALFKRIKEVHGLSDDQINGLRALFSASGFMGQGNPDVTHHPMTREECQAKAQAAGAIFENPEYERICGAKHMVPLFNPKRHEEPKDAKACIDRFEFPNIPCEYPVVWTKAKEAELACEAEGKRLCDAGEWEGGCAGEMLLPDEDYHWSQIKGKGENDAIKTMRYAHNNKYRATRAWSYGPAFQKGVCGQNSTKDNGCNGGDWKHCGSNTYPSGSFPDCHSPTGVFDINGNAAEHMNLPLNDAQMTSKGSKALGYTEMKGSWFIWDKFQAHEDWCRWRAPYWHGSRVMEDHSHANYHLSFRCCNDATLAGAKASEPSARPLTPEEPVQPVAPAAPKKPAKPKAGPTTTMPGPKAPATTAPATTVPATTVPATTVPATDEPGVTPPQLPTEPVEPDAAPAGGEAGTPAASGSAAEAAPEESTAPSELHPPSGDGAAAPDDADLPPVEQSAPEAPAKPAAEKPAPKAAAKPAADDTGFADPASDAAPAKTPNHH